MVEGKREMRTWWQEKREKREHDEATHPPRLI